MTARHVQLRLAPASGTGTEVVIEGQDVTEAIRSLTLHAEAGDPHRLVLTMSPLRVNADAEDVTVELRPEQTALLERLGWTPPASTAAVVAALRDMADRIDRGPTFPVPPSVISALVRERADDIEAEQTTTREG